MEHAANARDSLDATCIRGAGVSEHLAAPTFRYDFECLGPDGEVKWRASFENLVTTVGKNDLLDKYFAGSAYTAAFYLGLKGTGSAAAADTMSSHSGWSEVTPYSGNRPALSWSAASGGSKSASQLSFSITGSATVAGGFVSTTNAGTSGVLYSAGDFSNGNKTVSSGDTLNVTLTVSA